MTAKEKQEQLISHRLQQAMESLEEARSPAVVVTANRPGKNRWTDDFKRRKS
jgi:hypothetical protein